MNQRIYKIWQLALPSIISNITVPLLGLVDVSIVGHIGDARYISAVAVGSMLFNVIYWVFGFLRMGTGGMTSQCYGRRDIAGVLTLLGRTLMLGVGIGALFVALQCLIVPLGLWVMRPEAEVASLSTSYCHVVIWGAPAVLGLYGLTGWFVGMQNTRFPMVVSILQNVVNICASVFMVYVMHMDIIGVAAGTAIAQWFGFLLALLFVAVFYRRLWRMHSPRHAIDKAMMSWRNFFVVNRDIFLRTLFLVSVFLFFTSAGSRQGSMTLAANTLLMEFFTVFSYFTDGFAYAGEALGGRYYGAGNRQAFREMVHSLFLLGGWLVVIFTLLYIAGGRAFLHLLTSDVAVVEEAMHYFGWVLLVPVAGMAAFLFDGIFVGITNTRGLLLSSVLATLVFFAVYLLTKTTMANHGLWLAFVLYLAVRGIVEWGVYMRR